MDTSLSSDHFTLHSLRTVLRNGVKELKDKQHAIKATGRLGAKLRMAGREKRAGLLVVSGISAVVKNVGVDISICSV